MKVEFTEEALGQIAKLDKPIKKRIFDYMEDVSRLEDPRTRGKALVGNLAGQWRYRVGDYRVLCKIKDELLLITVVDVGHRRNIYGK